MKNLPFKKIVVALDLTEMDESILKYLDTFAHKFKPEQLHFIHVVTRFDLPLNFVLKDEQEVIVLEDRVRDMMRDSVKENFPSYVDFDSNFHVANGRPEKEILSLVEARHADLTILGRKRKLDGTGLAPNRLMRHSKVSTLLISEGAEASFEEIFLPTDFSFAAAEGALIAKEMLDEGKAANLSLFYASSLPTNYFPIAAADSSYKQSVEIYARKQMVSFANTCKLNRYQMLINPVAIGGDADAIVSSIEKHEPDLVVVGEKKHSDMAVFLLGSVTEKVIQKVNNVPLLIVRAKGEATAETITLNEDELIEELESHRY